MGPSSVVSAARTVRAAGVQALLAVLVVSGCADASRTSCRVGADCASGICLGSGMCARPSDAGGTDAGTELDARIEADGGLDTDAAMPDGGGRVCSPDRDGTIARAEVPLSAGLHATFRVAEDAPVDLVGTSSGGTRRWDLSGALGGDSDTRIDLVPVTGAWYAPDFPGASYAARLSASEDLLGVFEITSDALLLRGVVSPDDGLSRTRLTYDPPVPVLRFPLREGDSWSATSSVTGLALGVASFYSETYASQVDAAGELATPFGSFPVLRVRTVLDRTVGVVTTRTRTFAFVSECFGTVATVTSDPGETAVEFTRASELRRLAP